MKLQSINPNNARAIDIKYHTSCYIKHVLSSKSDCQHREEAEDKKETNEYIIFADCGLFSLMKSVLSNGQIKHMSEMYVTYHWLLKELEVPNVNVTKATLKIKIEATLDDGEFSRLSKIISDLVCSQATKNVAVGVVASNLYWRKIFRQCMIVQV